MKKRGRNTTTQGPSQAANAAENEPKRCRKAKHPSEASVNMTNSFEKKPRTKWPCVLQPLHVQSSTFNRNYPN